jgi:hypothetical protein
MLAAQSSNIRVAIAVIEFEFHCTARPMRRLTWRLEDAPRTGDLDDARLRAEEPLRAHGRTLMRPIQWHRRGNGVPLNDKLSQPTVNVCEGIVCLRSRQQCPERRCTAVDGMRDVHDKRRR